MLFVYLVNRLHLYCVIFRFVYFVVEPCPHVCLCVCLETYIEVSIRYWHS